jgi:hypothetical protein
LSSLGRKKEDPFAQKIITIKASHPIRKSSKSKSRQLQNKILAISTREREREREREYLLITRTPKKKLAMQKMATHLVENPLPAL